MDWVAIFDSRLSGESVGAPVQGYFEYDRPNHSFDERLDAKQSQIWFDLEASEKCLIVQK
ncbi:hypothetical protein [Brucella pseudogrignonensis]|uniref:hypothetical protein n=1 Tax=Brucella pseudogrignonensis TaxID=419475 RepID=UPI0011B07B9E|nr:hypothetical protein [Brucella pseudogrignonensis]MQP42581.1 hypothetical protein [Ochrobactrum sp. MYb237]